MRVHSIVIDVNLLFKIFHPHHHLSIPFIEPFWGVTFLHSKDIKREKYVADQTDLNQISTHNVPMPEMELSVVLESWDKKEKNEIKAWNLLLLDLSLCFATVMVQFLQKPDAEPQEVWNRRSTFQFPCYSNCRSRQHTQFSISNRQNWLPAVFVLIFAFSGKLAE